LAEIQVQRKMRGCNDISWEISENFCSLQYTSNMSL